MSSLIPYNYPIICHSAAAYGCTLQRDDEIRILIKERVRRNMKYWYAFPDRDRSSFWNSIASTINSTFNSSYTGMQCNNKFQSLKTEYYVSKRKYIHILYYSKILPTIKIGHPVV